MKLSILLTAGVLATASGCVRGENLTGLRPQRGGTPRDQHAMSAELTASADELRAWEQASAQALRSGLTIAPSFHERLRFPQQAPHAVAYRFSLVRGQSIRVRVEPRAGEAIFADMFQTISSDMFRHVFAARTTEFEFAAPIDGDYVLRLQPPLGGGGLFDVTVLSEGSLLFPVAGASLAAIGGVFGDPRDGGVRSHEGVDIFAPRGTAVLAVAEGRVTTVRHTPTGGRVVWLADASRELSYYYAHLEEQLVREGAWVVAGDTVGTVGTSGNAVGTRPHLHFGIYRPGTVAVDPAPFLAAVAAAVPADASLLEPPLTHSDWLGQRAQTAADRVRLRASPSLAGAVLAELRAATSLLVLGIVGDWQRVVLDDGTTGFIAARYTVPPPAGTR